MKLDKELGLYRKDGREVVGFSLKAQSHSKADDKKGGLLHVDGLIRKEVELSLKGKEKVGPVLNMAESSLECGLACLWVRWAKEPRFIRCCLHRKVSIGFNLG